MASYRLPRSIPIGVSRSFCPGCRTPLGNWQLVPLLSFMVLRGKCASCHSPISARYFLIELAALLLTVSFYLLHDLSAYSLVCIPLAWVFLYICVVDIEHYFIEVPQLVIVAIIAGVLVYITEQNYLGALLRAMLLGGAMGALRLVMNKIMQRDSMGSGDLVLFAIIGLVLPWPYYPILLFISGCLGVIWSKFMPKDDGMFPFAPSIILSFLFCLLYPNVTATLQFC